MSVDYSLLCRYHRTYCHLGQIMGGRWSFGYGQQDATGREFVGEFIRKHCHKEGPLEIMTDDALDNVLEDDYSFVNP